MYKNEKSASKASKRLFYSLSGYYVLPLCGRCENLAINSQSVVSKPLIPF